MASRARSSTDSPDTRHKGHASDWNGPEQLAELKAQNDKKETENAEALKMETQHLDKKEKALETIGDMVKVRLQRWLVEEILDKWRLVMAAEQHEKKSQAQAIADRDAEERRTAGRAALAATASRLDEEVLAQERDEKRQELHWRRLTAALSTLCQAESNFTIQLRSFVVWTAYAKCQSWAIRAVSERAAILTMGVLSSLVLCWRLQVGTRRCEQAMRSAQEGEAELPGQVKEAWLLRSNVLLERCFPVSMEDSSLIWEVFHSWSTAATLAAKQRSRCERLMSASLRRTEEASLLAYITSHWRGSVCTVNHYQAQEGKLCQENSSASLARLQMWMEQTTSVAAEAVVHAALIGWQSAVAQKRLQQSVEMVFTQCQAEESMTLQRRHELQKVEEALAVAGEQWATESERLLHTEASLAEEVSKAEVQLAEANQELKHIEALRWKAKDEAGQLAAELAAAEESLRTSTVHLHGVVETEEAEECEARVLLHEEEAAEARQALEKMENDLAKQHGRRQRESRDVRQQFRTQITRAQEATQRFQTARADDQATWADRLQVSLHKRHRLEQEIKTLRRSAEEVLPKCSEMEEENSQLQEQCGDTEARLRHLEVVERGRRDELATLKCTRAEWWRRCETLANSPFTARSQMPASTRSSVTVGAASATF